MILDFLRVALFIGIGGAVGFFGAGTIARHLIAKGENPKPAPRPASRQAPKQSKSSFPDDWGSMNPEPMSGERESGDGDGDFVFNLTENKNK